MTTNDEMKTIMNYNGILTKNQIDHIIKTGKKFDITIKKEKLICNHLTFKMDGNVIYIGGYKLTNSFITGGITLNPFSYTITIEDYSFSSLKELNQLYNNLEDKFEFFDWLEKYVNKRLK